MFVLEGQMAQYADLREGAALERVRGGEVHEDELALAAQVRRHLLFWYVRKA